MTDEKQIVEINGVKMEIDLRYAKRVDHFRIGDRVKVLTKDYNDTSVIHHGVIVSFENFTELPTIVIAYIENTYNPEVKFGYFNKDTKGKLDVIVADDESIPIERNRVIEILDRKITEKELEIDELKAKKKYFLTHFQMYFEKNTKNT